MDTPNKPVERLFPFVLRAGLLVVGRESLWRMRQRLQFVLVTTDLSENSEVEIRRNFNHVPIMQRYVSTELETIFQLKGTKVVGFKRSSLARTIMKEMAAFQIQAATPVAAPPSRGAKATEQLDAPGKVPPQARATPIQKAAPPVPRINRSRSWSDRNPRPPRD